MINQNSAFNQPPKICSLQIVDNCFMKCKMCYNWEKPKPVNALSNEDWKIFFTSLKSIAPAGTPVFFTGTGEPLAREGVLDLIRDAALKGFSAQMPTNGFLIDDDMARGLADSGLDGLGVSLDSLNEQTHDFLRGVDGTYARVMKAFGYLRKYKIDFSLMTTIMERNINEIIDLVKWSVQEKIQIRFQAVSRPFGKGLDDQWYKMDEWKFLWPQDTAKTTEVINELIKLKASGYPILNAAGHLEILKAYFENPLKPYRMRRCNAGDFLMNLDIFGNLHPCAAIGICGNIKEMSLNELWFSEKAQGFREKIYACQIPCHHLINCFFEEEA